MAQPYYDAAGNLSGVVAAALTLTGSTARSPETHCRQRRPSPSSTAKERSWLATRRANRFVGTKIPGQSSRSYMLTGEGVREGLGFDGVFRTYAYTPLPGGPPGLTLSVGLDKAELLKGSEAANRRDISVIAGSSILALILAGIGARAFIGRPIRILLDAAEHWRQGDLRARVPFSEIKSEFGRLGGAFKRWPPPSGCGNLSLSVGSWSEQRH